MAGCINLQWWLEENKQSIFNSIERVCKLKPGRLKFRSYSDGIYITYTPNQYTVWLAQFRMEDLPYTESIGIVSNVKINDKYRNCGLGQYLHSLRIKFAKEEKINFLMATTRQDNEVQNHIMKKYGWKIIKKYTSKQYQEKLYLWMLEINSEKKRS